MSDIDTTGNAVWDSPSPIAHTDIPAGTFTLDVLPPFKMLASDEEREKKAQSSVPGTYHVICVPESFSDLPEYAENEPDGPKDLSSSPEPGSGSNRLTANVSEVSDPNILILRSFRDARGNPYLSPRDSPHSPNSDLRESSLSSVSAYTTVPDFTEEDRPCPLQPHEIFLLDHFRTAAWRKVIPWAGIFESPSGYEINSDVFEQEAAKFPPLLYAMMAISALSLYRQGVDQHTDPSLYCQQAVSSLQASMSEDKILLSDGPFLAHFLILVFETAAAKSSDLIISQHHISRILRLALLRRCTFGSERFSSIVWWVCHIDLYSLLSGAGTGEFVQAAIGNGLLSCSEHSHVFDESDMYGFQGVLPHLYQEHLALAVQLGLSAAELRRLRSLSPSPHVGQRLQEMEELRQALRQLWNSPEALDLVHNQAALPKRLREMFHQISIVFHTTMLFSYTSLWPGQGSELNGAADHEMQHHATMILRLVEAMASTTIDSDRHLHIFPIFLAGVGAPWGDLKIRAWELLSILEEEEMGYRAAATCYMLQLVYERQMQQAEDGTQTLAVEWMDLLSGQDTQSTLYA
ncbi:uncharacterized protein BDW47DRAFT_108790 [Aspergillus candidus]|uniref:Fungal-specific transcription factor domain-domain-containing protein n=1 Tax=Aspergillus candidus TaxID=41067 RepID=A0A2I2F6R4_ASPCN|nr:hypothetical protein BDW47DRAFT_108790 [Aspergillus candidus]PLB36327.1 hypothetical protein BDW47DRAFT_108790 [Aspergillus candidus]